jgi:hypothetical protein
MQENIRKLDCFIMNESLIMNIQANDGQYAATITE